MHLPKLSIDKLTVICKLFWFQMDVEIDTSDCSNLQTECLQETLPMRC